MPPLIDRARCRVCGICIFQCGKHVFAMDGDRDRIEIRRARDCAECFICESYCPEGAITVKIARKGSSNGG